MALEKERIKPESLEDQLETSIETILETASVDASYAPPQFGIPKYWHSQLYESSRLGITGSAVTNEGAVRQSGIGERVDIHSKLVQPSILGIKLAPRRIYSVTRWLDSGDGYHKVELDPQKGRVTVSARAKNMQDRGVILPLEKMVFERNSDEYENSVRTTLALLGELVEAS